MEIKKVGVIGCGLMGSGITQVVAGSGYQTMVREINQEFLNKGMSSIQAALTRQVERGRLTAENKDATLSRVAGTIELSDLRDCDIIIEAVIEDMAEKKKLFSALDGLCPDHTILASNTSSLSIIEMATATRRLDRVIGTHFFNPPPVMKLLELVRSIATSDETVAACRSFGESLGKTVIVAKDTPGFIVNRLLVPYLLDAVRLLEAGVASREDIDNGMAMGCNHPMGPLGLLDLVGLDTLYFVANAMYDEFKDPKYAPPPLLKKMVLAGRLGQKSGQGFYEYKK
ncbi:MAG: 3-hydroxybutyryl-CoA dehydrogenase [Chloroflexi bacterium]|nr:3-hydroxybutyryl-CoA dehydrogenase [Chloroflexota bacterium]